MNSTFGTVEACETLARTSVAHVLLGKVQSSGLPAAVFVFGRFEEPQAVEQWLRVRALRSVAEIRDVTIFDAQQTDECFFVCVAWPATGTPSSLPASLARTLAWLESASRDDLGIRVTDVLRSLERLEPRQVPRTVMLEARQLAAAAADAAAAEPAVNPRMEPASPSLRPTRLLHHTTLTESPVILQNDEAGDGSAPVQRGWIGLGLGVGALAGVLAALYMRGQEPKSLAAKATTAYASQPAQPFSPPAPLPAPAAPQDAPPPAQPTVTPDKSDDAPAEVVIATRQPGATVCDAKTGKILGRTPLRLPADRFDGGHKIWLSRPGFAPRSFHWPADHLMSMKRLGGDELQPPSPCGF